MANPAVLLNLQTTLRVVQCRESMAQFKNVPHQHGATLRSKDSGVILETVSFCFVQPVHFARYVSNRSRQGTPSPPASTKKQD